ncbi:U-scoloptoxin(01)-Cw1a-like 6, partial [Homarus americanus]
MAMTTGWTRWSAVVVVVLTCLCLPPLAVSHTLPVMDHGEVPLTDFSCIGKIIGGYYADVFTECQMFHVCTINEKGKIHDYTFRCLAGTVFDQETRVCERSGEVNCSQSESFFHLNNDLYGPGIIPPTADSEGTPSAAKVQVLDPTVALMGASDPPTVPPATSEVTTPSPPPAAPSQPQPQPTSSPPPPVIPPGVTASTTRMSTSTSSSVTSAYSFPPLPFTVSRTSTSVSASSHVRIQTPLAQISLQQGVDHSVLPAPHLRPSLLRLAAEAQNAAQAAKILEDHNPTASPTVTAQTPANFEDVPRLSVLHLDTTTTSGAGTSHNHGGSSLIRQKRQLTPRSQNNFSPFITQEDATPLTATASTSSSQRQNIRDRTLTSTDNTRRTVSSRGRVRFRQPDSIVQPHRRNPVRGGSPSRVRQPSQVRVRQRVSSVQARQDDDSLFRVRQAFVPAVSAPRITPVPSVRVHELVSGSQQRHPVLERQSNPSVGSRQRDRVRVSRPRPTNLGQVTRHRPMVFQTFTQDSSTDSLAHHNTFIQDTVSETPPSQLADPPVTPIPPTFLTAEFPPDSHISVFDGDQATARTTDSTSTSTADFTITTTTTPSPPFVFPETSFSCLDKIPGGLYADVEAECAVFHICSVEPDSSAKDNKFVCGSGTLFDQKSRTCQTAALVDCASAASFYYLNDPLKGPVYLELETQHPEQRFDFPRILKHSSSPSSISSQRGRRSADRRVDLCSSSLPHKPQVISETKCREFVVCKLQANGTFKEMRKLCKKDYLFSPIRHKCYHANKVHCDKETKMASNSLKALNSLGGRWKRRAASLLRSRRFRRAALPPLANLVMTPGVEDARVRRALYSLAALQQWTLENAKHSTFIEVYALQTDGDGKVDHYPKKVYVDSTVLLTSPGAVQRYGYIHRKRRDVANITVAEQVLTGNTTKVEDTLAPTAVLTSSGNTEKETNVEQTDIVINTTTSVGSLTLPTIATTTISSRPTALPTVTVTKRKDTPSVVFVSSFNPAIPTAFPTFTPTTLSTFVPTTFIPRTLSTFTISPVHTSVKIPTDTATRVTVTVTTTKTIVPTSISNMHTEISPTGTAGTHSSVSLTTAFPTPSSTTRKVNSVDEVTSPPAPSAVGTTLPNTNLETTTSGTQPTSESDPISPMESPPTPPSVRESDTTVQNLIYTSSTTTSTSLEVGESPVSSPTTPPAIDTTTGIIKVTESTTSESTSTTEGGQSSSTVSTTTAAVTPSTANGTDDQNENTTVSNNITITSTTESLFSEDVQTAGSVNVSTTEAPKDTTVSDNSTTTAASPSATFDRENLPETNFTCKDKKLEQFYPDPEANCQVFHYCSPGFNKKQVLDLKFLCTGATMFDINTQNTTEIPKVNDTTSKHNWNATTSDHHHLPDPEVAAEDYNTTTTTTPTQISDTTQQSTPETTTLVDELQVTTIVPLLETTENSNPETVTVTYESLLKHQEEDVATDNEELITTTVIPTEGYITETNTPQTDTVTERDAREEISTSTMGGFDEAIVTVTEFTLEDNNDLEISTELGPIFDPETVDEAAVFNPVTEDVNDIPTTELNNVDVGTEATTLSPTVNIPQTSTDVSVSTNISAFSNHSASSETSMSSDVSVSSNVSVSTNHNGTEAEAVA